MKKPLTIYSLIPPFGSASFYYRLAVPLYTARDLGLPVRAIIDTNDANVPPMQRVTNFCEADLIYLYQPIGDGPINNIRNVNGFIPSKRDDEWKWPPSVVIETDDNLFNVSPMNQAFRTLGIRDMNGTTIPLGSQVGDVTGGQRRVRWVDTSKGFTPEHPEWPVNADGSRPQPISIAANRQTIESWRLILTMADAVQCSTPPVAEAITQEQGVAASRVRVFPNLVRFDHYEQVDLPDDPRRVKILWQGGAAHEEDWYPLREALGNITRRYPQVHWVIWGAQFPWAKGLIPAHRMTFKSWCPYHEYKLRLAMIGHDISLAPLSDNVFNRCRSAIKFYESSVLKKPAATLAQRTAAYKAEIQDGETALLFDDPTDFEEKLARLIEDATERKRLAANAKDWVNEHRDAMKEVPKIVSFWEQLREERKREQPHVSERQWQEIELADRLEQQAEQEQVSGA